MSEQYPGKTEVTLKAPEDAVLSYTGTYGRPVTVKFGREAMVGADKSFTCTTWMSPKELSALGADNYELTG